MRIRGPEAAGEPVPVAAAAHYHMGGIAVSATGRSSLPGLWACGEASSTGLHGANRLASNGLLEALVYARRAALDIADQVQALSTAPLTLALPPGGRTVPAALICELRALMTSNVGVVRDAQGLQRALIRIAELEAAAKGDPGFLNMTATATLIAAAALIRQESRGAHCRSDFPAPDPAQAHRSRLTLTEAMALRQSLLEAAS